VKLQAETHSIVICLTQKVLNLKTNLGIFFGLHEDEFYLKHHCKIMQDDRRLADYHINNLDSIEILFRLKGGVVCFYMIT
jgi:Ubiquitin family